MLKGVQLAVSEIIAAVRLFHADIVGDDVPVYAGDIHPFFQFVVIDAEACYFFHSVIFFTQAVCFPYSLSNQYRSRLFPFCQVYPEEKALRGDI